MGLVNVSTASGCVMEPMTVRIQPMSEAVPMRLVGPINSSAPMVNVLQSYGHVMGTGTAKIPRMNKVKGKVY